MNSVCGTCAKSTDKTEVFLCVSCGVIFHLTSKCTGFSEAAIAGLKDVNFNILLLCNECVTNGQRDKILNEMATQRFFKEHSEKLEAVENRMMRIHEKIEETASVRETLKETLKDQVELQFKGASAAVQSTTLPSSAPTGIRIRGLPEPYDSITDPAERAKKDLQEVQKVLAVLGCTGELNDVRRIGKNKYSGQSRCSEQK